MSTQGTEQWRLDRLGKPSASRYYDIMKGDRLAGWKNYRAELVTERLTGIPTETFTSAPMQWGTDTEPLARLRYLLATGNNTEECGFFEHPTLATGASPDGLIGEDGGLEIKCPNTATHISTLRTSKVPDMYMAQIQGGMWITGRKWWDYVSFDPRLPDNAALFITRVTRNAAYIEELEAKVRKFLKEVEDELEFVKNYKQEAA